MNAPTGNRFKQDVKEMEDGEIVDDSDDESRLVDIFYLMFPLYYVYYNKFMFSSLKSPVCEPSTSNSVVRRLVDHYIVLP